MKSRCSEEIMEFVICQAMTFLSQVKSNCQNTIHKFHGIVCQQNSLESEKYIRVAMSLKLILCNFKERYTLQNILHYIQPGQSVSNTWDDEIDTRGKYLNKMSQKLHGICHSVNNVLS